MSRPVRPSSWVTCSCGKVCRGRAGLATHGRACPVEQARSAAFIAAIEDGHDAAAAAASAVAKALVDRGDGAR